MRRALAVVLGIVSVVVVAPRAGAAKLPLTYVVCGQVIDESIRVGNNLAGCPDDGLVVGNPGITIDLNGHRISGTSGIGEYGIDNSAGYDDVRVVGHDGVIYGFEHGVFLYGADRNHVSGLTVTRNLNDGVVVFTSSYNVIGGVFAIENGRFGFLVQVGAEHNVLRGNNATGNFADGILLNTGATQNTVRQNKLNANVRMGLLAYQADRNVIAKNTMSGNRDDGIQVQDADENLVDGNKANQSGDDGLLVYGGDGNTIRRNRLTKNTSDGIEVTGGSANSIRGNVANENGQNGITADAVTVNIDRNSAYRNGFSGDPPDDDIGLGITTTGGLGSGNRAGGNDDPAQCAPTYFCS